MPLAICSPAPNLVTADPTQERATLNGLPGWCMIRYGTSEQIRELSPIPERPDRFWLKADTLSFLADNPQGFSTESLVVQNKDRGITILLTLQIFQFSASGNVRDAAKGETSRYDIRRRLLSPFSFKVANIGQFLTSGPYCDDGLRHLPVDEREDILESICDSLLAGRDNFTAVILKDLVLANEPGASALCERGFYALPVDPILEISIPDTWLSMDDYLAEITSKYRVRYRRARGKFKGLKQRTLSAAEVRSDSGKLHDLYLEVSSGADYNAAKLTPSYLPWLAELQEATYGQSGFTAYFDGSNMIGFTSSVRNGSVCHAHYLGMVDRYKFSHHLYHNMLFDLLESAIQQGFQKLDYGRTALEIKSSIGAVAIDYACLIKAKSHLLNRLIPIFTPAVYSPQQWRPRSPFKSNA